MKKRTLLNLTLVAGFALTSVAYADAKKSVEQVPAEQDQPVEKVEACEQKEWYVSAANVQDTKAREEACAAEAADGCELKSSTPAASQEDKNRVKCIAR